MIQQPGAGILQEVKHMLKAFLSAVVGVGYFTSFVPRAELTEEADPGRMKPGGIQGEQVGLVLPVHGKHEVEFSQVRGSDLPGQMREVEASPCGGLSHARVGALAFVPSSGARRVDFDAVTEPAFLHQTTHDAFSGRRAADVAEADKEQAEF